MTTTRNTNTGRDVPARTAQNSTTANLINAPAPAGSDLSIAMSPGSGLRLDFDPGQATLARDGNDLIFRFDEGGSLTVTDFFVVGEDGELPMLTLPGGDEVPSALAFADSGLDLSTAAGAAGAAPGTGAGDYNDDPGNLTNGIDRLGSQGTQYWGYESEISTIYQGQELPGGDFSFEVGSDLGGLFGMSSAVYEDGLPYQHQGDRETFVAGQLLFNFTPTGSTVVTAIHLSGFDAGTVIYFGDPSDPNTVSYTVSGPDEVLTFSPQDFADGLYLVPPANSDADMNIRVELDLLAQNSGMRDTVSGSFTIVVDAVADRPELGEDLTAVADSNGHHSDQSDSETRYDKGLNTVESTVSTGENGGGAQVFVTVSAVFDDYLDGSEQHFLLVQTHGSLAIDANALPEGYSYVGVIVIDGVEYHQIAVDNTVIEAGNGDVSLTVPFTTTGDAAEKAGQDESFDLKVGAYAKEDVDPKGEIDLNNNTAHVVTEDGQNVGATVDVVNSTLTVSAGWASEGNNAGKHANGAYNPDYAAMDEGAGVDAGSTSANGAPISIGLDAGTAQGSAEYITSAELNFDEGRGDLLIDGQSVYDGMVVSGEGGVSYSVSVDANTGAVTITVSGGQVSSLDELNLSFRPATGGDASRDDSDVGFSYKVNVSNGAGASATYTGETEIVIDAVADKPVNVGGAGVDYGDGQSAAQAGQSVTLSFTATFPDMDGSESHTLYIRVDGNTGSATHGYANDILSPEQIAALNSLAGSNLFSSSGDYLAISIPPLSAFGENNTCTLTVGGSTITITYNGNGSYTVSGIEVTLPDADTLTDGNKANGEVNGDTGNANIGFNVVARAEEQGGKPGSDAANNEHDKGNNNAFTNGSATVTIATVGADQGDFSLGGGSGFENDTPLNNLPADPAAPTAPENNADTDGGVALSVTWNFADSHEYVSEIQITVPLDGYGKPVGVIVYNGVTYTADEHGVITIPVDAADSKTGFGDGDLVFVPVGHDSGAHNLEVSATVVDSRSGDEKTVDAGDITVAVDAVANRSGEVTGQAVYDEGNSAVATGDTVSIRVSTTFDDNDGSERHYLLVEQNAHWQGDYEVEYYDLDGDGVSEPYFKVPVPGSQADFTEAEWLELISTGTVTTADGVTVSLSRDENGEWDASGPWTVTAVVTLDPPALSEGEHSLATGSLAEENNINHATENREDAYSGNNVALRPGGEISFTVNNTEGISVNADFLYEAGQVLEGGPEQSGVISVTPSSPDDSFYGELSVSIPAGHGDLYYNGQLLEAGQSYEVSLTGADGKPVSGSLTVTEQGGKLTVTFTPDNPDATYKGLELEARLDGNDHSDKDIAINVTGNLQNNASGQQSSEVGGSGKLVVDATAQTPDVAESGDPEGALVPGGAQGVTVTLTADFADVQDGSESQYFLVEAVPGLSYTFTVNGVEYTIDVSSDWPMVRGEDGTLYYRIEASPNLNGSASLDVTVKATDDYLGNGKDNIRYGAMSVDNTSGDTEVTYDNNIAIDVDNSLNVNVDLDSGSGPVSVDIAYENNTPNAHTGDTDTQYAKINLPDDAQSVTLTPGAGSIYYFDGENYIKLTPDENGRVTVGGDKLGSLYYGAPENYDDQDLSLGYQISGGKSDGASGSAPVYVDAVAQQGSTESCGVETGTKASGDSYSHVGQGEATVLITLSGLDDPHDSTSYYALVQAVPGWECTNDGAELVLIDGEAYYRVPIDPAQIANGKTTVEVTLKTADTGADGTISQDLKTGSMVVDRATDGEYTMDNNVAVNIDGSVTIDKSVAETSLVLNLGTTYEDALGDAAAVNISGVGHNDVVSELHLAVDSGEAVFLYNGVVLDENGYSDEFITITLTTVDGKTVISISAANPDSGLSAQDLADHVNGKLAVQTADGNTSNKDIGLEWGYTVQDTLSGDTASVDGKQGTVIVDAVAHKPEVDGYQVDYGDGRTAAEPGDSVTVRAGVTFTAIGEETNYVLVQFSPGWEVTGVTLTVNGVSIHYSAEELLAMDFFYPAGSGTAYYKLPLEKGGTSLGADTAEGGSYTVDVAVETTVPSSGIKGDSNTGLGIGGAAVDSYGDGETNLSNNVDSSVAGKDGEGNGIHIGVVDSTGISASQDGDIPEEGGGNSIGMTITPQGGGNDVITGLTLTVSDSSAGSFYYDGVELTYGENGSIILPPAGAGAGWVFDSSKLEFRPGESFGGTVSVHVTATVSDAGSGASKDGFSTDMTLEVTATATAPTGLNAVSGFDAEDGGLWHLTINAAYADVDGSESHFFLFTIPDGLTLVGDYPGLVQTTGPNGEEGYWMLPVNSTDPDASVELSFRADSSWDGTGVEYHAGSSENGQTVYADAPEAGNVASPAADGAFGYLTEQVNGAADFSADGLNAHQNLLIYGGDGDDTITGGLGSDTIYGGEGNDVIHAGSGGSLIIGGAGDDTLFGGDGADVFFWDQSHFAPGGSRDTVLDFEYGKDTLSFEDVFGEDLDFSSLEGILAGLEDGAGSFADNSLSIAGASCTLSAGFTEEGVSLTITTDSGQQNIDVSFGNSGYQLPDSAADAAQILYTLLNQGVA